MPSNLAKEFVGNGRDTAKVKREPHGHPNENKLLKITDLLSIEADSDVVASRRDHSSVGFTVSTHRKCPLEAAVLLRK
jgi:hypothetical protein